MVKQQSDNVAIAKVKIPKSINRSYIYWLLKSHIFQSYIRSLQRTAQNGFNKTDLGNLPIPLPPLAEQNRIVEKLDKLFGHLDVLKERLDKIPQLLKDFRQSVLSQAVSGELTAAWREGKTKRWSTNKLSELVITLNQGWSPKCYNYPSKKENVWGVIKTTSVQPMKYLEEENKELPSILKAREQHELSSGELLITRAGPRVRVGICCLVRKTRKRLMICDKVYRLVLNQDVVLPEFIEINLNSPETQYEIEAMKTGTSESGLNLTQGKIKELELEVPPPLEQKEIVRRVESLFVKADTIEQRYTALKEKINHLPQALLAKAFRGELVPQLPGDGDARELLEEIGKVREEMSGKK